MDKYVRHVETKLFLTQDGRWTSDLGNAWRVKDLSTAVDRIMSLGIFEVEVYYAHTPSKEHDDEQYLIPWR